MSKIEVNAVEPQCGTTLTLGASGDTVTLGSGASQSGFGRTGTVDWQTTVKTTAFTAVSGEGYFCNTTSAAFTVTLPSSPSALDIVAFKDYALTFDTNSLTLDPGSNKIEGNTLDMVVSTEGRSLTLVYLDSTQGWKVVNDGNSDAGSQATYVTATGGTITTSGNFKIHTFTGPGTFCVSCNGSAAGSNTVDYLVIAGGGGGATGTNGAGTSGGAGGGAGGYRESPGTASGCYTVSPRGASPAVALPVTVQGYPITVGAGGAGGCQTGPFTTGFKGASGSNSVFSTITSAGGGGGGTGGPSPNGDGISGGSGGGAGSNNCTAGSGNTPPVNPAQGTNGGNGACNSGGGGGGALTAGAQGPNDTGGTGGGGATSCITASPVARAGGGGGGGFVNPGPASAGGGAGFGGGPPGSAGSGTAGTANTGGGGGGANSHSNSTPTSGGTGGSGVVIIRYRFQ